MLERLPPQRDQRGDAAKAIEQSQGKAEAGGARGRGGGVMLSTVPRSGDRGRRERSSLRSHWKSFPGETPWNPGNI